MDILTDYAKKFLGVVDGIERKADKVDNSLYENSEVYRRAKDILSIPAKINEEQFRNYDLNQIQKDNMT